MTLAELIAAGHTRMRLPHWRGAYLEPNPTGPWAKLYDIGAGIGSGAPIAILIGVCDLHADWEPVTNQPTEGA